MSAVDYHFLSTSSYQPKTNSIRVYYVQNPSTLKVGLLLFRKFRNISYYPFTRNSHALITDADPQFHLSSVHNMNMLFASAF